MPTISIKGSKFFTSDGDQFYIKGVVYQASASNANALVDGPQCASDAQSIKELGANVIRVYSVDPTLNHTACMNAFADVGIYVIVDMSTPFFSINRAEPEWTRELRDAFADVVDGFQKYDNTFGFFAGNEIVNDADTSMAAPHAKAIIADMKTYRDLMQYRNIPIGYSAADIQDLRQIQQSYFACGSSSTAADMYGFTRYSWCGSSSMEESGYDQLYQEAENYPIPIFFSENGCKIDTSTSSSDEPNRTFSDQPFLLGRNMNDRYSGNIIYEWHQNEVGYGLVSYDGAAMSRMSKMSDFSNLQSEWATLTPAGVKETEYNPSLTAPSCPDFSEGVWSVSRNEALPTIGMAGFTTPTGPRSTSVPSSTGTGSRAGNAAAETSGALNGTAAVGGSSGSRSAPIGAIVGCVVGGILLIALLLAIFFRRRRRQRKRKQTAAEATIIGTGPANAESDKMVAGTDEDEAAYKRDHPDYYGPRFHEMSENHGVTELDPSRGNLNVNEMESGLGQMGELPGRGGSMRESEGDEGTRGGEVLGGAEGDGAGAGAGTDAEAEADGSGMSRAGQASRPYVQAQRKTEMDWLESEEARLRQRREQLLQQSQSDGET